jgi:hypothetical protein
MESKSKKMQQNWMKSQFYAMKILSLPWPAAIAQW